MSTSRAIILAAIDYSAQSASVVDEAVATAQKTRPAELHFLHVYQARTPSDDGQEGRRIELMEWLSARLPTDPEALESISIVTHDVSGDPAPVIVRTAAELGADLVIVGTHARTGLQRMVLGSVAEAVSRRCGCSVQVVRHKDHDGNVSEPCALCVQARLESRGQVQFCRDHEARQERPIAEVGVARWLRQSLRS